MNQNMVGVGGGIQASASLFIACASSRSQVCCFLALCQVAAIGPKTDSTRLKQSSSWRSMKGKPIHLKIVIAKVVIILANLTGGMFRPSSGAP